MKGRLKTLFLLEDENLVEQKRKDGIGKQGYCLPHGITDFISVKRHIVQELYEIPRENGLVQIGFVQKVKLCKVE